MASNKVMIGLPTMSYIHTNLMMTLLSWIVDQKVNLQFNITNNESPVDKARNMIVDEFLKSDCTHLLFIDSDTIPPKSALYKLLEADKDIISALTPMIRADDENNTYKRVWNCVGFDDKHVTPNQGIVPIKGAGSSCILIKRKVFDIISRPYYRFTYQDDNGKDCFIGEDIFFIIKAISKGVTPYADTDILCSHYKNSLW